MRSPLRAVRRRSAAAKRFYLFRELSASLRPLFLLLSFGFDHGGWRSARKSLVAEALRQRGELSLELLELRAQLATLLGKVDQAPQGNDHFGAVSENGVSGACAGGVSTDGHRRSRKPSNERTVRCEQSRIAAGLKDHLDRFAGRNRVV